MKITVRGKFDLDKQISSIVDKVTDDLFDELRNRNAKIRTPVDKGNARDGWKLSKGRRVNTITNSVPYIERLDEGHSKQAPKGIIKPTVDAIRRRKYKP